MSLCQVEIKGIYQANYPVATTLSAVAEDVAQHYATPIVAFKVNGQLKELHKTLVEPDNQLEVIDLTHADGVRIYQRSLAFVFIRAVKERFEDAVVDIQHSLSKGLFCVVKKQTPLTTAEIDAIKADMQALIVLNEPFIKRQLSNEQAMQIFAKQGMKAKVKLLKYRSSGTINVYQYGWLYDYFYGYMMIGAGQLQAFDLTPYDGGVILRHPTPYTNGALPDFEAQPKVSQIHRESEQWGDILKVGYIYNINELIQNDKIREQILITEALHEKKIAQIADLITREKRRIVLIAGPSSSGKTTFANRLKVQLRVNGLKPVTLGTDDYFVDREFTPKDEAGNYDFESIDAVDLKQFNADLAALIGGDEVELPSFNFQVGKREYIGHKLKIKTDQPIIIEGIHGLNPKLTAAIADHDKFKIYISCLTQLNIDNHNRIPTTDSRLIRRIVRDNNYRGHSAKRTLEMWSSVRRGEERNIFPYQETADIMFNSAIVYELAVLKKHIEPLLLCIDRDDSVYSEAKRLLKFLSYVLTMPNDDIIPNTSIIKEFIGGSIFYDH